MQCKCKHSTVCKHRESIQDSIQNIVSSHYGGINPKISDIDALVQKICEFRDPED